MGDLAVRFGFYGGGWDGDLVGAQDEAGEALTISDTTETWLDCLIISVFLNMRCHSHFSIFNVTNDTLSE